MPINTETTVGQLVAHNPAAASILEQAGIDYCCGGHRSLTEACREAKQPVEAVAELLEKASAAGAAAERDWATASQADLVDHIVGQHHAYVRREIPRLQALIAKVRGVHGKNHPELTPIANAFDAIAQEMTMHMMKEEQILFPYIVAMEKAARGETAWPIPVFGSVENPVRLMMMEHDSAGANLRGIRELSDDFTPPADGCTSYRVLYTSLAAFEADLHQHIHLENNILFPQAIDMEAR